MKIGDMLHVKRAKNAGAGARRSGTIIDEPRRPPAQKKLVPISSLTPEQLAALPARGGKKSKRQRTHVWIEA